MSDLVMFLRELSEWWMTGLAGIVLYWLPAGICAVYSVRLTIGDYRRDLQRRSRYLAGEGHSYRPVLTVGVILLRAVVPLIPVANLMQAVFRAMPSLLYRAFSMVGRLLNAPLVPAPSEKR